MVLTPNLRGRETRNLSPRARDLNQQLSQTIDTFRRQYPDTTDADVRVALFSASTSHAGGSSRAAVAAAALGSVFLAGGVVVAMNGGLPDLSVTAWMGIAAAAVAVIVSIVRMVDRS